MTGAVEGLRVKTFMTFRGLVGEKTQDHGNRAKALRLTSEVPKFKTTVDVMNGMCSAITQLA